MVLYISAHPANAVFKLSAGRVKRVAQGDIDILVDIVIHHDYVTRHVQGDPHVEAIALVFMLVRLLDGDMAAHQVRMKGVQLFSFFTDMRLERIRATDTVKDNL